LAGIHCVCYAIRDDQKLISRAHGHGGGSANASFNESKRHTAESAKPLDRPAGPAQEGRHTTGARIGKLLRHTIENGDQQRDEHAA
jgi:hypothetical protein